MYPTEINPLEMFEIEDDFLRLDVIKWVDVNETGAGIGVNTLDAVTGGQVSVVSGADDNDYQFRTNVATGSVFKLVANKPIWFVARFTHVEANTDDQNFYIGLTSVIDTTVMGDDGAGPVVDGTLFGFYNVDGDLKLGFVTSNSTTQTKTEALITMVSGRKYQIGFHADPGNGTTATVTPWVYDETLGTRTVGTAHKVAVAALAACQVLYGCKAGGANAETLSLDYIRCAQKR